MLTLMDNNKKWQIISFFLDYPTTKIHLRALARKLKISPTGITKNIKNLVKEDLILVDKNTETKLLTITANRESLNYKRLKISYNLYSLQKYGLLKELIKNYHKPEAIILFGSYGRGEDIEKSDIDLAVITTRKIQKPWIGFEKKLNRKIKVMELKKEKIQKEFLSTLANGIVLYGYLGL